MLEISLMKSTLHISVMLPLTLFTISSSISTEFETSGDQMFRTYFERETAEIADQCLADIQTLDDWNKDKYRSQLYEMLSLEPLPPKTPLQATVTRRITQHDFDVWNLHYQ